MEYLFIVLGFVLLIVGANYLVDGASGLAKRYNVPDLVIGLTVVAFGTSMPEMVVNIMAALNHSTEIALTNIIGSNTINTLVILGVSAAIYPIATQKSSCVFDIPMSLLAGCFLVYFSFGTRSEVSRFEGTLLLLVFLFFMFVTVRKAMKNPHVEEEYKPVKMWLAILMMVGGLIGLIFGGDIIVKNATQLALKWNVPQSIVGITIVALGTSLPELATSAVAAFKKNSDMALGNVIGSNIFNVFFVLGISATIFPLPVYNGMFLDALTAGIGSLLVLLFVCCSKKQKITRWQGLLLLAIYAVYLVYMLSGVV